MTPLRIAVVCYPALGGSGVIASELALGLAGRGHRVHLVATALPERLRGTAVGFVCVDVPTSPVFEHAPYGEAVLGAAAPAMVMTLHGTDVTVLGSHPSLHAVTAHALEACAGLTTPSRF